MTEKKGVIAQLYTQDSEGGPLTGGVWSVLIFADTTNAKYGDGEGTGPASTAFVTNMANSFAETGFCTHVIGPQAGGAVKGLNVHTYKQGGEFVNKVPTEVKITDRREYELAEHGFITMTYKQGSDQAAFFSANSSRKPDVYDDPDDQLNEKVACQLPYMLIITRLAHYLKVIQRENLGSSKDANLLSSELNKWIGKYVSDMENPDAKTRRIRPLRKAQVSVTDIAGEPGAYKCDLEVVPHMKFMEASFSLSLVGKLTDS